MRAVLATLALACLALASPAGAAEKNALPKPSANQGRIGAYSAETGIERTGFPGKNKYAYYVDATHYSPDRPAGLHLFMNAQGGGGGSFAAFEQTLSERNLIGINMWYQDGDMVADTDNKVRAAKAACAQVIADYKILVGRGILAAYQHGGVEEGAWWSQDGANAGTVAFPFCLIAQYSAHFQGTASDASRVAWFFSVTDSEWILNNVGPSQCARAKEAAAAARKIDSLDWQLMLSHRKYALWTITAEESAASSALFARSELLLAPVAYEPDFAGTPGAGAAQAANAHAIGLAIVAADKAMAGKCSEAELARLRGLAAALAQRVTAMRELIERLAIDDPILCAYYGRRFVAQLGANDAAKSISTTVAETLKSDAYAKAAKAQAGFAKIFPDLFSAEPSLKPEHKKALEQIAEAMPAAALTCTMARMIDALPAGPLDTGPFVAKPSANAGKAGVYECDTRYGLCGYWVDASHYSPDRPAGIHLFMHSQGNGGAAKDFSAFAGTLSACNLIGINMRYDDGEYTWGTGKVQAAQIACQQVAADYRILPGRGILAGVQQGGYAIGEWWAASHQGGKNAPAFPFSTVACYACGFDQQVGDPGHTAWFFGTWKGETDWSNNVGREPAALIGFLQGARKCGSLDVDVLRSQQGGIDAAQVAAAQALFERNDLVYGALVCESDLATPSLQRFAQAANAHQFAATLDAIAKALAAKQTSEDERARLTALEAAITARMQAIAALIERLATTDPLLALSYGRVAVPQFGAHELGKGLSARLAELAKSPDAAKWLKAQDAFFDTAPKLIAPDAKKAEAQKAMAQIADALPRDSALATMARSIDGWFAGK